jgi:hypothetical protein
MKIQRRRKSKFRKRKTYKQNIELRFFYLRLMYKRIEQLYYDLKNAAKDEKAKTRTSNF